MSDYKPTFRVSPKKRPWYKRLTPLAWTMIGVAVLVVILAGVAAAMAFGNRRASEEPWWTPTPTLPPSPTPIPPTPTPTATPGPVPAHPAWWTDQMTQDEDGNWWPPEEVAEMVREHFQECVDLRYQYLIEAKPPDLDGYEQEVVPYCTTGERQVSQYDNIQNIRQGINLITWAEWENGCFYQVQEWSEDGLECTLGQTCSNGTGYDYDNLGQLVNSEHLDHSGLILWRMRYDPTDGRWKIAKFIKWIPPNQ